MFLNIVILILVLVAFYSGARRGWLLQAIRTGIFFIAYAIGLSANDQIVEWINLLVPYPQANFADDFALYSLETGFNLDTVFYQVLAMLIVLVLGWFVSQIVMYAFRVLSTEEFGSTVDIVAGGLMNVIIYMVLIYFVLLMLSTLPVPFIQEAIDNSGLAKFAIQNTPFISAYFNNQWLEPIVQ